VSDVSFDYSGKFLLVSGGDEVKAFHFEGKTSLKETFTLTGMHGRKGASACRDEYIILN
jgi:hypothetical protein